MNPWCHVSTQRQLAGRAVGWPTTGVMAQGTSQEQLWERWASCLAGGMSVWDQRHVAVSTHGQSTQSGAQGSVGPALAAVLPRARQPVLPRPDPKLTRPRGGHSTATAVSLPWA